MKVEWDWMRKREEVIVTRTVCNVRLVYTDVRVRGGLDLDAVRVKNSEETRKRKEESE